jgi:large subunit ribosomal protein L11
MDSRSKIWDWETKYPRDGERSLTPKKNYMAKEVSGFVKLQCKGGQANPAPPIGPALGSKGINIMEFCKQFNARTQDKMGKVLPVLITVYTDKSFEFVIKTPPAAVQLLEAAKIQKGSKESNRTKVGKVNWSQVEAIAKDKMPDLNCFTIESAMKMVAGTARSMGLNVEGKAPWDN